MRRLRWMALVVLAVSSSSGCPNDVSPPKEDPVPTVATDRIDPGATEQEYPSEMAGEAPPGR